MQPESKILMLDINLIIPNKYQPRKVFDEQELTVLSESIKTYGILNPILVRQTENKYEIIAGERRYRAAKMAGLTTIPVIVKTASEQQMAELALIENIQRRDLSPIEEAKSYEEILKIGNQTQEQLASKIGKSQSSIANKMRLLSLPAEIQEALVNRKISERHARSLLTVEDKEKQIDYLNQIIEEKLTVKETEQLINEKEITEEEIKQAINDIMKSLSIDEEKEEKEDDNMNNGNFFPNFDNNMNNINNTNNTNNTSLNMMNMQSMEPTYMEPQNEMVMPTPPNIVSSPMNAPTQFNEPQVEMPTQFDFNVPGTAPQTDNTFQNNNNFINPQPNFNTGFAETPQIIEPMTQPTFINPVEQPLVQESTPVMQDTPLFNPAAFEVPVTNEPVVEVDRLTTLQTLLNNNGYTYKVYSNETDNCVIIELPKN